MAQAIKQERLSARVPQEVMERVRNAVYWTPGLTIAGMTAQALEQFIDQIEAERGEPFPRRQGEIQIGRPVKM